MIKSIGFKDSVRKFAPESEKLYSWWSYRARDWEKSDRGRRLDHIWTSRPLEKQLKSIDIIRHARDWEKPSDHVPCILDIN